MHLREINKSFPGTREHSHYGNYMQNRDRVPTSQRTWTTQNPRSWSCRWNAASGQIWNVGKDAPASQDFGIIYTYSGGA